jgi:repressor of nif and glnA expression
MDGEELTRNRGRRGHIITHRGLEELAKARIIEKVGFLAAKIDQMTYQMEFDLSSSTGTVVVNVSIVEASKLESAARLIQKVFAAGYAMGRLMALFPSGERIGGTTIADGMIGIGTVCSITLNGVLLAHGIPTYSRFGGLLELKDHEPVRFVEIIHYDGTTLDPLEVFIRSGMTDYAGAVEIGTGKIGASFRELPAESREHVITLAHRLDQIGLGGFMAIGWPSQPLLEIPVRHGRAGAVVMGGLNPAGILEESGIPTHSRALAALAEYDILFPYDELDVRIRNLI